MSQSPGGFCLVLHGHLPYVARHGLWPHGETWLYEAMAETYLPLLDLIGDIALNGVCPAITLGITPVLLEQLGDEYIKTGFVEYLQSRAALGREDRAQFLRQGEPNLAELAVQWEKWYLAKLDHFERIGRDIPKQFKLRRDEGNIQILTGAATHAYLPLLLTDQSIRAQLGAGAAVTARYFGASSGLWLPECAYRPASDSWRPPVLEDAGRYRPGIESFLSGMGVNHTFLDSPSIVGGQPLGVVADGRFFASSSAQAHRDRKSGWRESLEPVGIASEPGRAEVFALARHPRLAQQVWSSKVGYPGDGNYLEFHKKHGPGGLRYWRVTDVAASLEAKETYDPNAVGGRVYANAQHFCSMVKDILRDYHNRTGRRGVCVAAFDAELFGHWWFEGPKFLRDVILTLAAEKIATPLTAQSAIAEFPPDKIMRPLEGSWGRGGDHTVWLNDETRWMWEVEHRCEKKMVRAVQALAWGGNQQLAGALAQAGRELLLLQASDWPFVVENQSALDYGVQRFCLHTVRFERAMEIGHHLAAGKALTPLESTQLAEMAEHDPVFAEIDLNWWK
ncbi:MAG: 1,4-alpha-glucan branching protein domain-containing protein [Tepidisphaeraceae bacterium]